MEKYSPILSSRYLQRSAHTTGLLLGAKSFLNMFFKNLSFGRQWNLRISFPPHFDFFGRASPMFFPAILISRDLRTLGEGLVFYPTSATDDNGYISLGTFCDFVFKAKGNLLLFLLLKAPWSSDRRWRREKVGREKRREEERREKGCRREGSRSIPPLLH
jgi:hypothetical protein